MALQQAQTKFGSAGGSANVLQGLKERGRSSSSSSSKKAPPTAPAPSKPEPAKAKPAPKAAPAPGPAKRSFERPGRTSVSTQQRRFVGVQAGAFDPRQRSQEAQEQASVNLGGALDVNADPGILPTGFNVKKFEDDQRDLNALGFSSG